MAVEKADKIQAVETYLAAVSSGNVDQVMALYADNATVEDPVGSEPKSGAAAIRQFYEDAAKMSVNLQSTGPVRCAGNAAAFPFKLSMQGLEIDVIDVFEFDEAGKVLSMKAYWGM